MFLFSCLSAFSQEDSLAFYFNKGTNLSAEQINFHTKKLRFKDSLSIYHIASKIITRENKTHFYHQVGKSFFDVDNYEAARGYYSKALEMGKLTLDKRIIAKELNALGNVYRLQDRNTIAMNLLFQATYLYKELNMLREVALNLSLIGDINRCIDQPKDALKYLNEALAICIKNNYLKEEAFCHSSWVGFICRKKSIRGH